MKKFFTISTVVLVGIMALCLGSLVAVLIVGKNKVDNLGEVRDVSETTKTKEKRALIILAESNSFVDSLSNNLYDQYAGISNIVMGYLFEVSPKDLEGMKLEEIVEEYGEPWLIDQLEEEAGSYDKVNSLLNEDATFDSFVQNVESLSEEGYIVDVVLNVHGSPQRLCFHNRICVNQSYLERSLIHKEINLGYVYQTACHGQHFRDSWITVGAKAVNGSIKENSYGIYAPKVFLQEITAGETFKDSVEAGYNYEVELWKKMSTFIPGFEWVSGNAPQDSKMVYAGDEDYKI